MTHGSLNAKKIAFLATDGVQEQEFSEPWEAVIAAGGTPELVSIKPGRVQATLKGVNTKTFPVDKLVSEVSFRDYDGLVVPGGLKNPDTLRMNADAVKFVRNFMEHDKPVGAICHAPWMLIEANAVRGRMLTSFPSLKTDIANAGGTWVDKAVAVDQHLITSRNSGDLKAFCAELIDHMASAIDERSLDKMVEQSFPASDPLPGPSFI